MLPVAAATQSAGPTPVALDFAEAEWSPAHAENFASGDRPMQSPIEYVVIHDIEGPALSAVRWFQNPKAQASAHYVIGPGKVYQQVRERDIAWHAGNREINARSVGIEHEGFAYRPGFYVGDVYETSARLVRLITQRYGIPRDRQHIIAHAEVPHPSQPGKFGGKSAHTDPGPWWDWDYYMALVRNDAALIEVKAPAVIRPGEKLPVTVTLENRGDDPWPALARRGRNPQVEAAGPVYLGLANLPPAPASGGSPLYDGATWISPRYLTGAQGAVEAGQRGTYTFALQGPRQLGEMTEAFRLTKVPPAPRMPAPFGPSVPVRVSVEPWELTADISSPSFTASPATGWEKREEAGIPVLSRKFKKSEITEAARWSMPVPIDGEWEVQARWPGGRGRTKRAVYEVATADGPQRVTVDPRKASANEDRWKSLGRFRFAGAKPVATVTLRPEKEGRVDAEAIRLVGPFPAK